MQLKKTLLALILLLQIPNQINSHFLNNNFKVGLAISAGLLASYLTKKICSKHMEPFEEPEFNDGNFLPHKNVFNNLKNYTRSCNYFLIGISGLTATALVCLLLNISNKN